MRADVSIRPFFGRIKSRCPAQPYLGPTIPAFISPNVLQFLVENYHLTPTSDPETDLKAILHE